MLFRSWWDIVISVVDVERLCGWVKASNVRMRQMLVIHTGQSATAGLQHLLALETLETQVEVGGVQESLHEGEPNDLLSAHPRGPRHILRQGPLSTVYVIVSQKTYAPQRTSRQSPSGKRRGRSRKSTALTKKPQEKQKDIDKVQVELQGANDGQLVRALATLHAIELAPDLE